MNSSSKNVSTPLLRRQNAFYDFSTSDRNETLMLKTKFRWVWMMKQENHTLWRVQAKSDGWFMHFLECKQDGLRNITETSLGRCTRFYIESYNNNGLENVEEITDLETKPEELIIQYRWVWKRCLPANNTWCSFIQSEKMFSTFKQCKHDGRDFDFHGRNRASMRLCIQALEKEECILETWFNESELYGQ